MTQQKPVLQVLQVLHNPRQQEEESLTHSATTTSRSQPFTRFTPSPSRSLPISEARAAGAAGAAQPPPTGGRKPNTLRHHHIPLPTVHTLHSFPIPFPSDLRSPCCRCCRCCTTPANRRKKA